MSSLIHSFYSQNCASFKLFMQNCYFLLSTLYAHNSDFEIDLYTDYDFGQLLEKAPYKNINIVFEEKDYSKINPLV